jgi:thiamine-phosphate pyrophosphorylase
MASKPARIVLITPPEFDPAAFAPRLADALAVTEVAAVILDLATDDTVAWRRAAEVLCPIAQERGAAFLIRDNVELVREVGADGVHVTRGPQALEDAIGRLKPDLIVGAGDSTTRHAAMVLGERQPDFVLLGRLEADEDIPATFNLIEWWSELFQLPCVAMCAESWDSAETAVAAGADFIALRDLVWNDPSGVSESMQRAKAASTRMREEVA